MSLKQLSPTETLRMRKKRLEARAEALSDVLESQFNYLHNNFIPLVGSSIVDSVVSKAPSVARDFIVPFLLQQVKNMFFGKK